MKAAGSDDIFFNKKDVFTQLPMLKKTHTHTNRIAPSSGTEKYILL